MGTPEVIYKLLKVDGKEVDSFQTFSIIKTPKNIQVNLMTKTKTAAITQRFTVRVGYVDETQRFDWEALDGATMLVETPLGELRQFTDVTYLEEGEDSKDGETVIVQDITLHVGSITRV